MKKIVIYCLLFILLLSNIACGNDRDMNDSGIALVMIIGKHGNANWDDGNLEIAREYMERAFTYEQEGSGLDKKWIATGNISVIVCDGIPTKADLVIANDVARVDFHEFSCTERTNRAAVDAVEKRIDDLIDIIDFDGWTDGEISFALRADNPEVDLLGAISEAQAVLNNNKYRDATEKHILIIDSGISTAGAFNMCDIPLIGKGHEETITAEDVVAQIPDTGFPDLSGIKVTFWGLGNVADPQMSISRDNGLRTMLEDIWTMIIKDRCNGELMEEIKFSETTGMPMEWNADGSGDYPMVTPIDFTRPALPIVQSLETGQPKDKTSEPSPEPPVASEPFTSAKLGFIEDRAEFVDIDVTTKILSSRALAMREYLRENPDQKVFIIGSIARIEHDRNYENSNVEYPPYLSQCRAEAVADILVENYGINESSLVVVGAGVIDFSWRNANEFAWGKDFEEEAAKNRVVNIFTENSEECDELLQQKKKLVLEDVSLGEVLQEAGYLVE